MQRMLNWTREKPKLCLIMGSRKCFNIQWLSRLQRLLTQNMLISRTSLVPQIQCWGLPVNSSIFPTSIRSIPGDRSFVVSMTINCCCIYIFWGTTLFNFDGGLHPQGQMEQNTWFARLPFRTVFTKCPNNKTLTINIPWRNHWKMVTWVHSQDRSCDSNKYQDLVVEYMFLQPQKAPNEADKVFPSPTILKVSQVSRHNR